MAAVRRTGQVTLVSSYRCPVWRLKEVPAFCRPTVIDHVKRALFRLQSVLDGFGECRVLLKLLRGTLGAGLCKRVGQTFQRWQRKLSL